jgi:hypothetical protein
MSILTFAQDFSSLIELDSSLIGVPSSGLFYNRGVHPFVTVDNILNHLPILDITFLPYSASKTYSEFELTRDRKDVVMYNGKLFESKTALNTAHTPATGIYWQETNIESLRMKSFIWTVKDNVKSELHLSRSLLENQYLYNVGKTLRTFSDDYVGWAFEPKNSDYVKIKINQISIQAMGITPISLYVINQGVLKSTITLTPQNGVLEFEDINYTISGKGVFYFVFAKCNVLSEAAYNDTLKYNSFVAYPVSGNGTTPETIDYQMSSNGNGLNFNVSCYLDSQVYIENNEEFFAKFTHCQFEMDAISLLLNNPNGNINSKERNIVDRSGLLATEKLDVRLNTVAKKYQEEKKKVLRSLESTFDMFLKPTKQLITRQDVL